MGWRPRWPMGHGSHMSWVKSSMGHLGHGSLWVTHSLLCNNQHDIKRRGQDFHTKFVFERVHSEEVDRHFLRNLTKRGVNKLFKKLRDTGTVNRRPGMADRTVPALKKTLSFFFRSSRSLPLTLFYRLSGEVTKNTFLSVKKTKSVAYCRNFWSRSLAHLMRAAQFASVSSCARCLLKDFRCRCKSLQIISDTEYIIYNQHGERLAILNTENIKICGWITSKYTLFAFSSTSAENLNF